MRILIITDTHGDIEQINEAIERSGADACIHCGDFGFYDEKSPERLTDRELFLRVKHSHLPHSIRKRSRKMNRTELVETIRAEGLLSGLTPYLEGEKHFLAPVYAVWGNHEDIEVVRALRDGEKHIENLHMVDEAHPFSLAQGVRLVGIGGNFYQEGKGLFASDMTGKGGKVRASWLQYARLLCQELERPKDDQFTIFVGHVSPGKVRLLERYSLVLGARLAVFGHMDPPITHAYSLFTICEPDEAMARSQAEFDALRHRWDEEKSQGEWTPEEIEWIEKSFQALDVPHFPRRERGSRPKKGSVEERYFTTQFLNVADAPEGWAVLEMGERKAHLETHSQWRL